MGIYPDPGE